MDRLPHCIYHIGVEIAAYSGVHNRFALWKYSRYDRRVIRDTVNSENRWDGMYHKGMRWPTLPLCTCSLVYGSSHIAGNETQTTDYNNELVVSQIHSGALYSASMAMTLILTWLTLVTKSTCAISIEYWFRSSTSQLNTGTPLSLICAQYSTLESCFGNWVAKSWCQYRSPSPFFTGISCGSKWEKNFSTYQSKQFSEKKMVWAKQAHWTNMKQQ